MTHAHNYNADRNDSVLAMAAAKATYQAIATYHGISRQRVQQILKAAGVPYREPKKAIKVGK